LPDVEQSLPANMLTLDFFTHRRPLCCSRGRVGSPNGVATIGIVTGWFFASPPMELLSTEGCELTVGTVPTAIVWDSVSVASTPPSKR
jgi:hypothetical protein